MQPVDMQPATAQPCQPEPHFPSPYARPASPLVVARRVAMPDGAQIAAFVYAPAGRLPDLTGERAIPVLMLHGNGEEHGIFGPIVDAAVTAGRTVVASDSRAQGKSTRGTAPLTYELMANDSIAVLDDLGVGRAHVAGFSDGAIEALLIARDHPGRVASVLSIGANLTPEGVIDEGWDLPGNVERDRVWSSYWKEGPAGAERAGAEGADVDPGLLFCTPEQANVQADLLQLMVDHPHIEAASLASIDCPTCVMAGENDCIVEDETRAIAAAIPGARLVIVPGMGHSLPKRAPADVARELLINILLADR